MQFQELLALIVAIPVFLFLSALFSQTYLIFLVLWVFCLGLDIHTTYKFYRADPANFEGNERNKIFSALTKKLGFKKATLIFPVAIEIPLLLFFSAIPLQILYLQMFAINDTSNFVVCLSASFGISAIGHLQAAIKNTKYAFNNKNTRNSV